LQQNSFNSLELMLFFLHFVCYNTIWEKKEGYVYEKHMARYR
jgi:hypothetical protein